MKKPNKKSRHVICFLVFLLLTISKYGNSQSCNNTDFEYGDFSNWEASSGLCCRGKTNPPGVVWGRHTIISQRVPDRNTQDAIMTMPPIGGGNFSVRLGNDSAGKETESLLKTFFVDDFTKLFIYQYALVLEDPFDHPRGANPKFEVKILDENKKVINPIECGYYQVIAGRDTDDWGHAQGNVRYKDWSTVGIDLSEYLGTTVSIQFSTHDCTWGGHFGYAYLDANCGYLDLGVSGFCEGQTEVVLNAPAGFDTYFWPHSGDTTQSVVISTPEVGDSIMVNVTNQSGCGTSILHVFKKYPLTVAESMPDTVLCIGQEVELWARGNQEGDQFLWFLNDTLVSNKQYLTVSPDITSSYKVLVANGNGCYSSDSESTTTVNINDSLFFELPDDKVICIGSSVNIPGLKGNVGYSWKNGTSEEISTSDTLNYSPSNSDTYTLEVSNSSCFYSDEIQVEVSTGNILPDTVYVDFCIGSNLTSIDGPGGMTSYQWGNGITTRSIAIDPYKHSQIQLNVTLPKTCPDSTFYIFNETLSPTATILNVEDTVCYQQYVSFLAFSDIEATTFEWTAFPLGETGSDSLFSFSILESSTIIVHATSATGCSDLNSYDTVSVFVDPETILDLGPDFKTICQGSSDTLRPNIKLDSLFWSIGWNSILRDSVLIRSPESAEQVYLYGVIGDCIVYDEIILYVKPLNTSLSTIRECNSNPSIELNAPSGYVSYSWKDFNNDFNKNTILNPFENKDFQLYATDSFGCVDTVNFKLDLIEASIIMPYQDEIACLNDTVVLSSQSTGPDDQYIWTSNPPGIDTSGSSITVIPQTNTSYFVSILNSDNCYGNPSKDTIDVIVSLIEPQQPVEVCQGMEVSISSLSTPGSLSWNYLSENDTGKTFKFIVTESGSVLINSVYEGCEESLSVPITSNAPAVYSIISTLTEICIGEEASLSLSPNNFNSVAWYADGEHLNSIAILRTSPNVTTNYSAQISDLNSCSSFSTKEITVNPLPDVDLGPDLKFCTVKSAIITPVNNPSGVAYNWSTGETSTSVKVEESNTYSLQVTLENGCKNSDEINVTFLPYSNLSQLPNIFTPNGDLQNDFFRINSENLLEYKIVIWNRWENIVFESNVPNMHWDGRVDGVLATEGVYYYSLYTRNYCEDKPVEHYGFLSIHH